MDIYQDWRTHGVDVIAAVRVNRPHEYLKVVASILPHSIDFNARITCVVSADLPTAEEWEAEQVVSH